MGQQQLILIILGVILVGIAIAVGIYLFNYNSYSLNRQAILAEIETMNANAYTYWQLPVSMGGAGKDLDEIDLGQLATYLDFSSDDDSKIVVMPDYKYFSDNGEYRLLSADNGQLVIVALGVTEFKGKRPYITSTYDMMLNSSTLDISAATDFEY